MPLKLRFSDLRVNGDVCNSSGNTQAATVLKTFPPNPNNTPVEVAQMFFLQGTDNSARKCRRYSAALPAFYFFTDDMPLFRSRLERENFLPRGAVDSRLDNANSSHVFMLSQQYSRRDGAVVDDIVCTYIAAATPQPTKPSVNGSFDDEAENGGSACFPATALVTMADGNPRFMRNLRIGDSVASGAVNVSSDIYFFSHRDPVIRAPFVVIRVQAGCLDQKGTHIPLFNTSFGEEERACTLHASTSLTLSAGHYAWTQRGLVRAADVRPMSDSLLRAGGSFAMVSSTERVYSWGLYAPHTLEGNLVVDGFRVSSYTAAVPPRLAHALLSPLRLLYERVGLAAINVMDYGASVRFPNFQAVNPTWWPFMQSVVPFNNL